MPFWFSRAFVYIQLCMRLFLLLLYLFIDDGPRQNFGKNSRLFGNPSVLRTVGRLRQHDIVPSLLTLFVLRVSCWIFSLVYYFPSPVSLVIVQFSVPSAGAHRFTALLVGRTV